MPSVLEKILERFATPAGLAIMAAFVIWLVQLNNWALEHRERLGAVEVLQGELARQLHKISLTQARQTAILDALFNQVQLMGGRIERNESLIYQNKNGNGGRDQ